MPLATSETVRARSRGSRSPRSAGLCSRSCSEPPVMYSSTMLGRPSNMHTPSSAQTHGWRSWRQMLTSLRKDRRASCSRKTLMTTRAPAQSPSHTCDEAPSSISFRTRRLEN
jgi:hypothetical protein